MRKGDVVRPRAWLLSGKAPRYTKHTRALVIAATPKGIRAAGWKMHPHREFGKILILLLDDMKTYVDSKHRWEVVQP